MVKLNLTFFVQFADFVFEGENLLLGIFNFGVNQVDFFLEELFDLGSFFVLVVDLGQVDAGELLFFEVLQAGFEGLFLRLDFLNPRSELLFLLDKLLLFGGEAFAGFGAIGLWILVGGDFFQLDERIELKLGVVFDELVVLEGDSVDEKSKQGRSFNELS
jgi:hypothetical protein